MATLPITATLAETLAHIDAVSSLATAQIAEAKRIAELAYPVSGSQAHGFYDCAGFVAQSRTMGLRNALFDRTLRELIAASKRSAAA
jgi:hypothetical protein